MEKFNLKTTINIETHSSGAYFTSLSNIIFTDSLADEGSFVSIENKNNPVRRGTIPARVARRTGQFSVGNDYYFV